jgi:hypothetical protein
MHFDRPIWIHYYLFDDKLDYRLAVLIAHIVQITPQESAELANIICNAFPFDRRVALLFQVVSFLLESFPSLRDLLAARRQVLQRNNLLLIRINEPLPLPLPMLSLSVDTVSLCLELALLAVLDLLPEGLCLQNDLRSLEQLTDQGPHQGSQTVGTYTTGGATLHAPHRQGIFAGTAIRQIFIALADAQLVSCVHGQLTLPTAHERPQEIPLRHGLIGTAGFVLVPLELLLRLRKDLRTDERWRRDGHPLL